MTDTPRTTSRTDYQPPAPRPEPTPPGSAPVMPPASGAQSMDPVPRSIAPESTAALGDRGEHVAQTYAYLHRFGYFPNRSLARRYPQWRPAVAFAPDDPEVFDETLQTAVRLFQEANGLP